jgi:hypothetical protein
LESDIWAYGNWGNPIVKLTGGEWQMPTQKENNDFVRGARDAAIAEGFEIPEIEESSGWLYPNTELYKWISDGKPSHTELVGREGHWKFDKNGKVVPAEVPTEEQRERWNKEWQATQPPEPAPEVKSGPSGMLMSNALSPEAQRLGSGQGFNPTQMPAAQGFASTQMPAQQPPSQATLGDMFDNLKQSYPQLDERLSPNTFMQPAGGPSGGGLSTTQQIALMVTLAALTGGSSGIAGGAMAGARALAPTVGRVAAPLGVGLLASLGLASPAYASGSSDVGAAAGSAVGDIRRQRALQSDRAAGRGRTRYQR